MKLGDFKGKRGAKAMAELMRLGEHVSNDPLVTAFFENVKGKDGTEVLAEFFKLAPILENDETLDMLVHVVALAKNLPEEQAAEECDLVGEVVELFTSDSAAIGFFGSSAKTRE